MNIVIMGDSWGCGTWGRVGTTYTKLSNGVQCYLEDDGHTVYNIATGGGSNASQLEFLKLRLSEAPLSSIQIDLIIMFYTEGARDHVSGYPVVVKPDTTEFATWSDYAWRSTWGTTLGHITGLFDMYHVPFMLIGACSPIPEHAPTPAIHSCFHDVLATHGVHRVNNFVWYSMSITKWIEQFGDKYPRIANKMLDLADEMFDGYQHSLFEPDQWHYNEHGCKLIYEWIKSKI